MAGVVKAISNAGGRARGLECDITESDSAASKIRDAGPFDILVNNAGIARHAPFLEAERHDFDAVVDLNLRATYFTTQTVARQMVESGIAGSVITISSQMGHVGGPDRTVYSATKHALEGMNKSAAIELGKFGVRFNTICPTFIRTDLSDKTLEDPEKRDWILSKIKLGRLAKVEDIMGALIFLAGEASAMVTGTSILIDGGWTAG
ncbi:NAD(P)-dependent dehydrogenase (short-subunit alcohol dehydrogenase family) [Rhizobium sp. BK176]|nr:NAD(P)-dependent dehydrogenase (short-subunit alcohol dehydrogenase family) [Rhizobium sp. BK176]